jgi:hypothetical protein
LLFHSTYCTCILCCGKNFRHSFLAIISYTFCWTWSYCIAHDVDLLKMMKQNHITNSGLIARPWYIVHAWLFAGASLMQWNHENSIERQVRGKAIFESEHNSHDKETKQTSDFSSSAFSSLYSQVNETQITRAAKLTNKNHLGSDTSSM